ncbi:UBP-type zinc finger domain-containing protein [Flavobacteriaceae bacterium 3-367]|uniref:UBP-type zinc finger domain-containing protein n=1 Tax=Eudoraea algarum TaxID=3417568 RepID=UPI00327DE79C
MATKRAKCEHLEAFDPDTKKMAKAYECETCVQIGDSWVHLRTCQACGVTLCCDSSPNKHASKHFQDHGHAVITSAEPNENWAWCYQDRTFLKF